MGYVAGQQDADTAKRLRPDATIFDVFSVGPQSHMLTGQVKVTPIKLELTRSAQLSRSVSMGKFL